MLKQFLIVIVISTASFFWLWVSAQQNQWFIHRYEFSSLLQSVVCEDCLQPSDAVRNRFSEIWLEQIKRNPQFALDDIFVDSTLYQDIDYYYCVASSADLWILQWFPRSTSPYCAWRFCGASIVTFSEVVTSLYRLYCLEGDCAQRIVPQQDILQEQLQVLLSNNILTQSDADKYTRYQPVQRWDIERYLWVLAQFFDCDKLLDSDWDGIPDIWDNCPFDYNPLQQDMDGDGVWDVCDDDIDWDGIKNIVWAVDPQWLPIRRKVLESDDNCILITNPNQENTLWTILGDACRPDWAEFWWGMIIEATPRTWTVPLTVDLKALWWPFVRVEWLLWDNKKAFWQELSYTYFEPWVKHIRATWILEDWTAVSALTSITVTPNLDQQIWYQLSGAVLDLSDGRFWVWSANYTWRIHQVTWKKSDLLRSDGPDDLVALPLTRTWLLFIESQAYNFNGDRVGLAQSSLHVHTLDLPVRYSQITASDLNPEVNQPITLSTRLDWIDPDSIARIEWSNWAWSLIESRALDVDFTYTLPGKYIITQKIIFENSALRPHENILTVHVVESWLPPSIKLNADPLVISSWEEIAFDLLPLWIDPTTVESVERRRWDNRKTVINTLQPQAIRYAHPWPKQVSAHVLLTSWTYLFVHWTVHVIQENFCLWEDLSAFRCDMDWDGIPDMCDDDIDGDWVPNWMWLLLWEPEDCVYEYDGPYINHELFALYRQAIRDWAEYDNCFLTPNPDQDMQENIGRWDACFWVQWWWVWPWWPWQWWWPWWDDITWPWWTWIWAPSQWWWPWWPWSWWAWWTLPPNDDSWIPWDWSTIVVETCTQCPCPEADYASTIWRWDRVRALLLDESWEIIYRYSQPQSIDVSISDLMLWWWQ